MPRIVSNGVWDFGSTYEISNKPVVMCERVNVFFSSLGKGIEIQLNEWNEEYGTKYTLVYIDIVSVSESNIATVDLYFQDFNQVNNQILVG